MYKKKQLNNGLKIIVSPMPQMSSVSLGIWIGIGGRYESDKESGISHFIEHMLFKGTKRRSAKKLKQAIEGVGGVFNGFTADEATCYMVKIPTQHLTLGLDILTDMVFNARFDQKEIEKEKFVICEEIKMYKDQPSEYVNEILGGIMWPDNSLGRPLTGTIKNVKGFKRDEMIAFRDKSYHPANMAVIATGNVAAEKIFSYAAREFKGSRKKKPSFKSPSLDQTRPRIKYRRRNINQAHVAMGFYAPQRNRRERFSTKLLSVILGGNMSSRLFEELREKYSLCYDISSVYKRHSDTGEFVIHAGVDNSKALKSVSAILDELRMIRDMGITGDELARAREYAKGHFLLALENTSARMMWFGDRVIVDKKIPEVQDLLKEIDGITGDDVKKACERIFRSSLINLSIVGNVSDKDRNNIRVELDKL